MTNPLKLKSDINIKSDRALVNRNQANEFAFKSTRRKFKVHRVSVYYSYGC